MFTFWVYGVNGVRNGVGASLFILAIAYADNIPIMVILALMGAGMHNSVYLMIALGVFIPILAIVVGLLIYTTSCQKRPADPTKAETETGSARARMRIMIVR